MDSKATRISPTMDNFCQNFKLQFRTKSTKIYQEILQKYRPLSVQLRKYSLYILKHLDGNFCSLKQSREEGVSWQSDFPPPTYCTVPLGDWLEKKKIPAIIIKQQFGFPMSTT